MKTGILQFDVTHNPDENIKLLKSYLGKNRCELVLLPELSICGYLFQSRERLMDAPKAFPGGRQPVQCSGFQRNISAPLFSVWPKKKTKTYTTPPLLSAKEDISADTGRFIFQILRKSCLTEEMKTRFLMLTE